MKTNYHKDLKKHITYAISWMTSPLWHIIHHYKTQNILVQTDTFSIASIARISRANDLLLKDRVKDSHYKELLTHFRDDRIFFQDFLQQLIQPVIEKDSENVHLVFANISFLNAYIDELSQENWQYYIDHFQPITVIYIIFLLEQLKKMIEFKNYEDLDHFLLGQLLEVKKLIENQINEQKIYQDFQIQAKKTEIFHRYQLITDKTEEEVKCQIQKGKGKVSLMNKNELKERFIERIEKSSGSIQNVKMIFNEVLHQQNLTKSVKFNFQSFEKWECQLNFNTLGIYINHKEQGANKGEAQLKCIFYFFDQLSPEILKLLYSKFNTSMEKLIQSNGNLIEKFQVNPQSLDEERQQNLLAEFSDVLNQHPDLMKLKLFQTLPDDLQFIDQSQKDLLMQVFDYIEKILKQKNVQYEMTYEENFKQFYPQKLKDEIKIKVCLKMTKKTNNNQIDESIIKSDTTIQMGELFDKNDQNWEIRCKCWQMTEILNILQIKSVESGQNITNIEEFMNSLNSF